jgi:hypothetical protein
MELAAAERRTTISQAPRTGDVFSNLIASAVSVV